MSKDAKIAKLEKAIAEDRRMYSKIQKLVKQAFPLNSIVEWKYNHRYGTSKARGKVVLHAVFKGEVYVENEKTHRQTRIHVRHLRLIERPA